jgi:hypothetical protein
MTVAAALTSKIRVSVRQKQVRMRAVRPNPSLKLSTNGRAPAPGLRYSVHCLSPGASALPLAPA